MAQCHRAARLPALPRPAGRDGRVTRRGPDRGVVGRPGRRGTPAVTEARWYARPEGGAHAAEDAAVGQLEQDLRSRPGSVAEYLEDTAELLAPAMVSGQWAL